MDENVLKSFRIFENVIFLKKTPLFAGVQTGDLRAVALIAEELSFKDGEAIVRESDSGDSMFIIKEGCVTITKKAGQSTPIVLAELSKGECFGDMAVFDTEVRSASVVAKGECTLLRITRDDMIDVILQSPSIALSLLKTFVKRLRRTNSIIESLSQKDRIHEKQTVPKQ